jgi:hypothetical protein
MQTLKTRDGRTFISHAYLGYSDYSGSSVERANVKIVRDHATHEHYGKYQDIPNNGGTYEPIYLCRSAEPPYLSEWREEPIAPETDCLVFHGAYGTEHVFILDTPDNRDLIDGLEEYPCVDDETVSEIETEWETEAWHSWLRSDLIATLPGGDYDDTNTWIDGLREYVEDLLDDSELFDCYREAMDATNTYPTPEHDEVHVDVRRIRNAFYCAVHARIPEETTESAA